MAAAVRLPSRRGALLLLLSVLSLASAASAPDDATAPGKCAEADAAVCGAATAPWTEVAETVSAWTPGPDAPAGSPRIHVVMQVTAPIGGYGRLGHDSPADLLEPKELVTFSEPVRPRAGAAPGPPDSAVGITCGAALAFAAFAFFGFFAASHQVACVEISSFERIISGHRSGGCSQRRYECHAYSSGNRLGIDIFVSHFKESPFSKCSSPQAHVSNRFPERRLHKSSCLGADDRRQCRIITPVY